MTEKISNINLNLLETFRVPAKINSNHCTDNFVNTELIICFFPKPFVIEKMQNVNLAYCEKNIIF